MPEIKLENIDFSYPKSRKLVETKVFENFSLNIESGITTVIMGASGSGKSTLLRLITGSINPDNGSIYFDGKDISRVSPKDRHISYVSEGIVNYPMMSAFKNIAFPLTIQGASGDEIRKRVFEVAREVQIDKFLNFRPKQLSIGQNQRVAIARALVKKPDLYIFDEMFSALDEETRNELMYDLKKILKEHNATSIFVTHYKKEAFALADKVIILDEGKVVEEGTPRELIKSKNKLVRELLEIDGN